jgi:uncharacterized membrane protein
MFPEYYTELKFIHVLAVILFTSNTLITTGWRCKALGSSDINTIRFFADMMGKSDTLFYSIASTIVLVTGLANTHAWDQLWVQLGLVYWIISFIAWAFVMRPVQKIQRKVLRGLNSVEEIPDNYWKLNRRW